MKQLLSALIAFLMAQSLIYSQPELVINEVLYFQDTTDSIQDTDHEWLELFNPGTMAVDLGNWTISNRDTFALTNLPDIEIPPGAFLVVHFRQGTDDFDFSDNTGHYFTQDYHLTTDAFSSSMDEVALYNGSPTADSIVDFLAWKASDADFEGGPAHDFAVSAGIWTADQFFNSENSAALPSDKVKKVLQGTSIGRDQDGSDTDSQEDWAIDGGIHANGITPGKINLSEFNIIFPPPSPPPPLKEWTFLVYLDGDNNLERAAWNDLNEMEAVNANDQVNVALMVDWTPGYSNIKVSFDNGNTFTPTTTAYRGFLLRDPANNPKRATLYTVMGDNPDLGEKNMGDPAVLTEFIQWGITNFPANKYAVIIWDHGNGWKATTFDDTDNDELHMGELRTALSQVPILIDLIGFDQCLMAMTEVAYQVYQDANVMVASEDNIRATGWPYRAILNNLNANPAWSAADLGKNIVAQYHRFYSRHPNVNPDHTLSAVALNDKFLDLITDVSDLGEGLRIGMEDYKKHYRPTDNIQIKIRESYNATRFFKDPNYIDLAHFAQLIKNNAGIPNAYKAKAPAIFNSLQKATQVILAEEHGPNQTNAYGLSIYFPGFQTKVSVAGYRPGVNVAANPYDAPSFSFATSRQVGDRRQYASDPDDCTPLPNPQNHPFPPTPNFLFPRDTKWDEFLHRYYEPVADAGRDLSVCVGQQFRVFGIGSSDADGTITNYIWDFDNAVSSDDLDWDVDCVDELNDDLDALGWFADHTYWAPGRYTITLTVWDDHNEQAGHNNHTETDQDELIVWVKDPFNAPGLPDRGVVSGGAERATEGSNCYDWTLGEWMTESYSPNADLAICQGFHQGLLTIVHTDEYSNDFDIQIFPNPTAAIVHFRSDSAITGRVRLMDLSGRVLLNKAVESHSTRESIDISHLPAAIYILQFQDENGQLLSSYKIQKT